MGAGCDAGRNLSRRRRVGATHAPVAIARGFHPPYPTRDPVLSGRITGRRGSGAFAAECGGMGGGVGREVIRTVREMTIGVKTMTANESEEEAQCILEQMGCSVTKILESAGKTPDFLCSFDGASFLVEVKHRCDSAFEEKRRKSLESVGTYNYISPVVKQKSTSRKIHNAVKQLSSEDFSNTKFRIIWLTASGFRAETITRHHKATLYGIKPIVSSGSQYLMDCYFFEESDFFKHRSTLDAAIICSDSDKVDLVEVQLCLNPLSPNYLHLPATAFVKLFGTAVVDPNTHEKQGDALQIVNDLDRKDTAGLLEHLSKKYSLKMPQCFTMNEIGSIALLHPIEKQ